MADDSMHLTSTGILRNLRNKTVAKTSTRNAWVIGKNWKSLQVSGQGEILPVQDFDRGCK